MRLKAADSLMITSGACLFYVEYRSRSEQLFIKQTSAKEPLKLILKLKNDSHAKNLENCVPKQVCTAFLLGSYTRTFIN